MSWSESKKINSDMSKPLDKLIKSFPVILPPAAYVNSASLLARVSAGDSVYSVTDVYTENETITAGIVTVICMDGNLYTDTPFVYGWILRA